MLQKPGAASLYVNWLNNPFFLVTTGMSIAAYQIVYVDCGQSRLYGELVQHMVERQTCWLRPISLRQTLPTTETFEFLDVSSGPDIICADHVIQPVLDTDWLTVLEYAFRSQGQLRLSQREPTSAPVSHVSLG
jgi:hypothetical protein